MPVQNPRLKGILKDMLLNSLEALSNPDYQKTIWFSKDAPIVDDYTDSITHYLDRYESLADQANVIKDLDKGISSSLKNLHDLVKAHLYKTEERSERLEFKDFENDPEWHKIVLLASKLKQQLNEFLTEKKE